MHVVVPVSHAPLRPVWHDFVAARTHGEQPSSAVPLQFSSIPLPVPSGPQFSATGLTVGSQTPVVPEPRALQRRTPAVPHAPVMPVVHEATTAFGVHWQTSSVCPLQSSSAPFGALEAPQDSAAGWVVWTHRPHSVEPLGVVRQVWRPAAQAPFSPVLHVCVALAAQRHPLSGTPSQSSSSPLPQTSGDGPWFGTHSSKPLPSSRQRLRPFLHAPKREGTSHRTIRAGWQRETHSTSSSASPSQSSSRPLPQISARATSDGTQSVHLVPDARRSHRRVPRAQTPSSPSTWQRSRTPSGQAQISSVCPSQLSSRPLPRPFGPHCSDRPSGKLSGTQSAWLPSGLHAFSPVEQMPSRPVAHFSGAHGGAG